LEGKPSTLAGGSMHRLLLWLGLTAVLGCSSPADPTVATCSEVTGPPWPATVAGCWMQSGVDTYAEFLLVQRGTTVNGTFSLCSALDGWTVHYDVTGRVVFPRVVLQWTERNGERYDVTFDARVTQAADTLAGTMAVNGQPPGPTTAFRRTAAP